MKKSRLQYEDELNGCQLTNRNGYSLLEGASTSDGAAAALTRVVGVERFIVLCELFGGTTVYIPKKERFLKKIRDEKIKSEFEGRNYKAFSACQWASTCMV